MDIARTLSYLFPYAKWICREDTYETLEMLDGTKKPTIKELEDGWILLQNKKAIPQTITPLQARLALNSMGIRKQVEDVMLTAMQDIKDFYEFALEWKRDNTQLISMATSLGMDSVAIDNFFLLASTL